MFCQWEQSRWPDLSWCCQGEVEQRAVAAALGQADKFTFCCRQIWALFIWGWPCYKSWIWTERAAGRSCAQRFTGRCSRGSSAQRVAGGACCGTNPALCQEGGRLRRASLRGTGSIAEVGKWHTACHFPSICSFHSLCSSCLRPLITIQLCRKVQVLAHLMSWKK